MSKSIVANGTTEKQAACKTDSSKLAAIYARVSTSDQAEHGYSLPTQIQACQAMARDQGYVVPETHVFQDDCSGTLLHRPGLDALRELVRQRLLQGLFIHDLDRLSRKLAYTLLLQDELESAGVALHVVTMPQGDKSPESQLLGHVRGAVAEFERAKLLERTARGLRGRSLAGKAPGGHPSFGYQHQDGRVIVDEAEAEIVRRIFRLYVEEGLTIYGVARRLTDERLLTPRDRRGTGPARKRAPGTWTQGTVHHILVNSAYVGELRWNKATRLPVDASNAKRTRWRRKPMEEHVVIPVPPIVDRPLWEAAQVQRKRNAEASPRNRRHSYLLSGYVFCGSCRNRLHGQTSQPYGWRHYRCTRPAYEGGPRCRGTISADDVESEVWQAVEAVLRNPQRIAEAIERQRADAQSGQDELDAQRRVLQGHIARCEQERQRWHHLFVAELATLDEVKAHQAEIEARRAHLDKELAAIEAQQAALEQARLETETLVDYCERVRQNLHRLDDEAKRLALTALGIRVTWQHGQPLAMTGSIPLDIESTSPW